MAVPTGYCIPDGRDLASIFKTGSSPHTTDFIGSEGLDIGEIFQAGNSKIKTEFYTGSNTDVGSLFQLNDVLTVSSLPESTRLRRTWMDHSDFHHAHWISNPAWRNGYGSLGGVNVTQAYTRRDGDSHISLSAKTSYRTLYVYFLEAQRYLLFTSSDGQTFYHTQAMGGWLFRIYETYSANADLHKVPSSNGYPTLFVSPTPFSNIGEPISNTTQWDTYEKNFDWIDWSLIDPTWGSG